MHDENVYVHLNFPATSSFKMNCKDSSFSSRVPFTDGLVKLMTLHKEIQMFTFMCSLPEEPSKDAKTQAMCIVQ